MATLLTDCDLVTSDPIDLIEQIVASNDWPFDRSAGELSVAVTGSWCDYHFGFTFRDAERALQMTCAFDQRVPPNRRGEIYTLLGMINEQLWLGHFDLWSEDGVILFRHASLIGRQADSAVCGELIELAISTCERFFPAFQFVLWGGKSPELALAATLLEPQGEA